MNSSRRTLAVEWRSNPAEVLVSGLFVLFLGASLVALHLGRPYAAESLQTTSLYAGIWALWLVCAVGFLPSSWRWVWIVRGIGPWVAVMQSYNLMRYLIPAVNSGRMDASLRRMEITWGMGASRWTHALLGHPRWTDFFCAIYLSLFAWMIAFAVHAVIVRRDLLRRFVTGYVLIYAGGFLGYMSCPATGPRYAYAQEWTWLSGGFIFDLCNRVIANMGAKLDVFPSLHVALSIYLLSWQARHRVGNLVWGIPLTAAIWLSTIFLGFHYAPDLAAGMVLGVTSFLLASRLDQTSISVDPTQAAVSVETGRPSST